MSNMILGKNGEITPKIMKRLSQSGNYVQLWMCLVVKVKSSAIKTMLHKNLESDAHESR